MYISYRVTGLYRLGKTCYLHSFLCKMILFQLAHGIMIPQPTFTPPQHVTGDVPLFAQKLCHDYAT